MRPRHLYLALCVAGTIVPAVPLIAFLREDGLDLSRFVTLLLANHVSRFFALDVVISAIVLWVLVVIEGRRRAGVRHGWLAVAASLVVGVSLGLPLFLYLRERALERSGR